MASIQDVSFEPGPLEPILVGLDFRLMNQAFAGFSDLDIKYLMQNVGVNYRLNNNLVLNSALIYNRYRDNAPYLYDTTGRYFTAVAGLNWVF
jgi:hypothetical protein